MNNTIQQTPIAAEIQGYRVVQAIEVHWIDGRPFPDAEKAIAIHDRAVWFGWYFDRRVSLEHPAALAQAIERRKLDRARRRGEWWNLIPDADGTITIPVKYAKVGMCYYDGAIHRNIVSIDERSGGLFILELSDGDQLAFIFDHEIQVLAQERKSC